VTVLSDHDLSAAFGRQVSDIQDRPDVEIHRPNGEPTIQPSSVDLHLDDQFCVPKSQKTPIKIDQRESYPQYDYELTDENGYFHIKPNQFVLAATTEEITLSENVVGFLWGRSSVGRLGLFVENAGLVDAGFSGDITLELYNPTNNTIAVKEGMRIVQLTVHELTTEAAEPYDEQVTSKYNGQSGVTPSRLSHDFELQRNSTRTSSSAVSQPSSKRISEEDSRSTEQTSDFDNDYE